MKYLFRNIITLLFICFSLLTLSCEKKEVPVVVTGEISEITGSSAVCTGEVISEGSSALYTRGICWSIDPDPDIDDDFSNNGKGTGEYSGTLTRLDGSTEYYARAYATNDDGTGYGEQVVFRTAPRNIVFNPSLTYGIVTDQEGNSYRTIQIGQQTWMAENLRSTHYSDGGEIPHVKDIIAWTGLTTGCYCYYDNDTLNRSSYGALYNWFAVDDPRGICPAGWHIPSDEEFTLLEEYLGGSTYAGMKMKEISQVHWASPNIGATNESGFTALPGGSRYWSFKYDFFHMGYFAVFWTSTEFISDVQSAWFRYLAMDEVRIEKSTWWKITGFSVRCVKD
ncbi:MAG: fibrobacter succinogenes major paralogous domain-containing protein [Bacteroidota bacterium]